MKKVVQVKLNAEQPEIAHANNGNLIAYLQSSKLDEEANQQLLGLLAQEFNVSRRAVHLKSSFSHSRKVVEIDQSA